MKHAREIACYWREVIAENWQNASVYRKAGQIVAWIVTTVLATSGSFTWSSTVAQILTTIPLILWILVIILGAPVARDKRQRDEIAALVDEGPVRQFKVDTAELIDEYKSATVNERPTPDERYEQWQQHLKEFVDSRPYLFDGYIRWKNTKYDTMRCGSALTCLTAGRLQGALDHVLSVKPPSPTKQPH